MKPAQTTDITLKEVLDALIERDLIPSSRIGPIKTAIKQYAIFLAILKQPSARYLPSTYVEEYARQW